MCGLSRALGAADDPGDCLIFGMEEKPRFDGAFLLGGEGRRLSLSNMVGLGTWFTWLRTT